MQDPTSKEEICDDCPAGWSNSNVGSSNCVGNPSGSYIQLQDGIDFIPCNPGYFCAGGAQPNEKCLPGSYSSEKGQPFCILCSPGTYTTSIGSNKCYPCKINMFAKEDGQTLCKQCPNGKMSPEKGSTSCQSCGAGEWGEYCSDCAVGMFRSGSDEDATICKSCPEGYHQDQEAGATCLPCVPGKFQSGIRQEICRSCKVGMFRSDGDDDTTICKNCPAGYHQDQETSATCLPCIPGKFQSAIGQEMCINCNVNQYASNSSSTYW